MWIFLQKFQEFGACGKALISQHVNFIKFKELGTMSEHVESALEYFPSGVPNFGLLSKVRTATRLTLARR